MQNFLVVAGSFLLFLIQSSFADETVTGIVVENNMEDPEMGAYLHITEEATGRRVFVVYTPTDDSDTCATKLHAYWVARGDHVAVRGEVVEEINGMRPKEHILSTCAESSYIRAKRLEGATSKE